MRLLIIADDDSLIGHLDPGPIDVLLSLGDLWDAAIEKAIERYRPERVFAVRGNHDSAAPFPAGIESLHEKVETFRGTAFGGFGGSWRYKPKGHHLYEQAEVSAVLEGFPRVDVFISHNSPAACHERDEHIHQGFEGLRDYVLRTQPKYLLHGHQHMNAASRLGETEVIGIYGERVLEIDWPPL